MYDDDEIEDLFRTGLNGIEEEPDNAVWERIEAGVTESIFVTGLSGIEEEPDDALWEKIEIGVTEAKKQRKWGWYAIPALLLLLVFIGFQWQNGKVLPLVHVGTTTPVIQPEENSTNQPAGTLQKEEKENGRQVTAANTATVDEAVQPIPYLPSNDITEKNNYEKTIDNTTGEIVIPAGKWPQAAEIIDEPVLMWGIYARTQTINLEAVNVQGGGVPMPTRRGTDILGQKHKRPGVAKSGLSVSAYARPILSSKLEADENNSTPLTKTSGSVAARSGFGISLSYAPARFSRLRFSAGLEYMSAQQSVTYTGTTYSYHKRDSVLAINENRNIFYYGIFDTTRIIEKSRYTDVYQYITLPLQVSYTVASKGRLALSASAGLTYTLLNWTKTDLHFNPGGNNIQYINDLKAQRQSNLGTSFGLSLSCKVKNGVSVFVKPEYTYYGTNILNKHNRQNHYYMNCNMGISYNF